METKCNQEEVAMTFPDLTKIQIDARPGFIKGWVEFLQERRLTPSMIQQ